MKVVACCAILVVIFALSSAEECREVKDCDHVTCPETNYRLDCHNRQCTCTRVSGGSTSCSLPSDCTADDCRRDWHCVDGICRCGFGFTNGK